MWTHGNSQRSSVTPNTHTQMPWHPHFAACAPLCSAGGQGAKRTLSVEVVGFCLLLGFNFWFRLSAAISSSCIPLISQLACTTSHADCSCCSAIQSQCSCWVGQVAGPDETLNGPNMKHEATATPKPSATNASSRSLGSPTGLMV